MHETCRRGYISVPALCLILQTQSKQMGKTCKMQVALARMPRMPGKGIDSITARENANLACIPFSPAGKAMGWERHANKQRMRAVVLEMPRQGHGDAVREARRHSNAFSIQH